MEKTILLAGKEMPEARSFTDGLKNKSRNSIAADGNKIIWNKASPISARSFILQSITQSKNSLDAVLYFDEKSLSAKFSQSDIQTCSQINDEYILSYQYITIELLQYFNSHAGKLAFVYNELPKTASPTCLFLKAAGAAFTAFAESTAETLSSLPEIKTILVHNDAANAEYQNDEALSEWICSYFDALDQIKAQGGSKKTVSWIKPGSKPSAGFALFH